MQHTKQAGFTLIELIVVVAIVAVVLAVGMMSLGGRDTQQQRQQWTQAQSLLQMACDQAAFQQRIYLVAVTEQGLEAYYRHQGDWLPAEMKKVVWSETSQMVWQVDDGLKERWQLPEPGWLCWPSGLVSEGKLSLQGLNAAGESLAQQRLRWDEGLNFVFED
ncbi:prepilin-type N-terminal cleavage/methylation domain-containing protein [Thiomicrospira microaerophila]|uniref:prepilin-type N-terminal cleavage/methylation domain-containing protein n=1 Tax=Thiomicrospira microaerophila TaxID=406020 RepID=UPI00200CBB6E|nr:prepilin-type N-terminal cleavage/methylation domain-containing protein [Thiomicrospira microaerophila]UQB41712.1 prepilin-type N-terminal cleavage/methylation domain-containing protein [Thiomicrospira microaerophila]